MIACIRQAIRDSVERLDIHGVVVGERFVARAHLFGRVVWIFVFVILGVVIVVVIFFILSLVILEILLILKRLTCTKQKYKILHSTNTGEVKMEGTDQ